MDKKQKKFRDIWVNQSRLGEEFHMSAIAIGKKLKALGLREADGTPTLTAQQEGYCTATPLKNGTPFFPVASRESQSQVSGRRSPSIH